MPARRQFDERRYGDQQFRGDMKQEIALASIVFLLINPAQAEGPQAPESTTLSNAVVECNQASLERAEQLTETVKQRFEVGLVAVTDAVEIDAHLLEQKYCNGKISKANYCEEGIVKFADLLTSVQAGYDVGTRTIGDLTAASQNLARIENYCAAD